MQKIRPTILLVSLLVLNSVITLGQVKPKDVKFVRQGVQRFVFNENMAIPLAVLDAQNIVGLASMHPVQHFSDNEAEVFIEDGRLIIESEKKNSTSVWLGGMNPFATYYIDLESFSGKGQIGFEFCDKNREQQFFITLSCLNEKIKDVNLRYVKNNKVLADKSITTNSYDKKVSGKIILQLVGSGLNVFFKEEGELPAPIGQADFNKLIDLRKKDYINSFQSHLYCQLNGGKLVVSKAGAELSTGAGQADIRAITYENGEPLLDQGRLWYTMSIRGRALPHHIQGVFSLDPSVFDVKLEGIIVFDRKDGILRNEIASHIFYDRNDKKWKGLTTGFSAYANPKLEKKQLLAIESTIDPRFGYSIMTATPFGMIGDIEDPHVLFDEEAKKWRMLTCENTGDGYKAIVLESDSWDKGYIRIAGPVAHNSTGTSIQKIGNKYYCFSGSSERKIFIYTYPDLKELEPLQMDLPPWDSNAGTRVWPNVVQLPEGYPYRYVALMMDRYNYPGLKGRNWTYGALYLYHGFAK